MKKRGIRPYAYGPPAPYCSAGHKRTVKNTLWRAREVGNCVYIEFDCRVCRANRSRLAYRSKVLAA